eukprot:TRINITY_DN8565_c0_g1_i1.p2 TRINITY_DN8565_c0_g1~~TRINITY_DN8565_c0_g1_i1.p2  ORF type:complete len:333 (+),score=87.66 TRINITY_DN8565_c0_g1_i1:255-1253(+)
MALDQETFTSLQGWFKDAASVDDKRVFLLCFVFLLKNIKRSFFLEWWNKEPVQVFPPNSAANRMLIFLDWLSNCVECFEHRPENPWYKRDQAPASMKNLPLVASTSSPTINLASGSGLKFATGAKKDKKTEISEEDHRTLNRNLLFEVNLIALDLIEDFIATFEQTIKLQNPDATKINPFFQKLFSLLLLILRKNLPESFFTSLFASLRSFVFRFKHILFGNNTSYSSELVKVVLLLSSYSSNSIRSNATGLLYLLLKYHYQDFGNFVRLRAQATMAISELIAQGNVKTDAFIKHALATLSSYAVHDYSMPNSSNENDSVATHKKSFVCSWC